MAGHLVAGFFQEPSLGTSLQNVLARLVAPSVENLYSPPNSPSLHLSEKVQVLNLDTGERLETYVITGNERGQIGINGPAALKIKVGHKVIIVAYGFININEVKNHRPFVVFPNEKTNLLK